MFQIHRIPAIWAAVWIVCTVLVLGACERGGPGGGPDDGTGATEAEAVNWKMASAFPATLPIDGTFSSAVGSGLS